MLFGSWKDCREGVEGSCIDDRDCRLFCGEDVFEVIWKSIVDWRECRGVFGDDGIVKGVVYSVEDVRVRGITRVADEAMDTVHRHRIDAQPQLDCLLDGNLCFCRPVVAETRMLVRDSGGSAATKGERGYIENAKAISPAEANWNSVWQWSGRNVYTRCG
jgi:hypothetical protein